MCTLERWGEFVRLVDPDVITGYNIQNFDIPYVLDRAKHIKASMVEFLGRVKDRPSKIRDAALQSKQMGNRVNKQTNIEGRVQFDVLQVKNQSK
uniref:DNA polymerase delta catalytic subunit n=1 Tax=Plectus sambesii TaxID=2011161 RepID=A0A914WX73_9BILA